MQTPQRERRPSFRATFSTVRSRRVAPPLPRRSARDQEQLERIAQYTWHCCFMSPFWGLEITNMVQLNKHLRQLERVVKDELEMSGEHQRLLVTAVVVDAVAEAEAPLPCISLKVGKPEARPTVEMLLCSVADIQERLLSPSCQQSCVWLPLQLARGNATLLQVIRHRLRATYGAATSCDGFEQNDMRWMAAIWLGQDGPREEVQVEYTAPREVVDAGLATITMALPAAQMKLIWSSVHPPSEANLRLSSMERFHRVLARVALDTMGLPVDRLEISKLVTPLVTVSANGRIHVTSPKALDRCLPFLRQLAYEFFAM